MIESRLDLLIWMVLSCSVTCCGVAYCPFDFFWLVGSCCQFFIAVFFIQAMVYQTFNQLLIVVMIFHSNTNPSEKTFPTIHGTTFFDSGTARTAWIRSTLARWRHHSLIPCKHHFPSQASPAHSTPRWATLTDVWLLMNPRPAPHELFIIPRYSCVMDIINAMSYMTLLHMELNKVR